VGSNAANDELGEVVAEVDAAWDMTGLHFH
jgi:hypothetical protein